MSSNGVQKNPGETSTFPEAEPPVAQPTPETTTTSNNTNTTNQKKDGNNNNVGNSPDPATQPTVEGTSTTNIKNGENTSEPVPKVESTTDTSNNNNGGNSGNLGICAGIWPFSRKEKKKQTNDDGSSTVRKDNSNSSSLHPGKSTEEGAEQCKLEDKKTMGELQNQTNLTSHNFSKQQYWVEEIFANLKNLPPPCSPDYIPLPQCLERLAEIHKEITKFKQQISSLTKLSKKLSQSADLKTSSGSNGQSGVHGFPNVHENKSFNGSSFYNEIQSIFGVLDDRKKFLLSCFAVLPENAVVKRRLLTYWGVGESLLDVSGTDPKAQEPEEIVDGVLKEFTEKGLIEPVIRKRKQKVKSYKMDPLVRSAVIMLSKEAELFDYDSKGNVVAIANHLNSKRACLLKEEESSSEQENQERRTKKI
uniref:Uncharacterized protein n=1 Tax=Fagus sylvatica TaxID=28930 RepID=A0A2N9I4I5_FAGSY